MEDQNPDSKWYQKKKYTLPLILVGAIIAISALSSNSQPANQQSDAGQPQVQGSTIVVPNVKTEEAPAQKESVQEVKPQATPAPSVTSPNLSNDNYYTNVDGNKVHSPAYADEKPAGASAKCWDGTYSFSQNRRGTCSHHGGVAEWY